MNKITYLVANYNQYQYIQDCIDSLNNQTSDNWLCIICDDASTDDTVQIIEKNLSKQITLIKNEENKGYIETLKRLIDVSNTEIVGILDPDDALYPNATQEVLDVYNNHETYGFVYTDHHKFDNSLQRKLKTYECKNKPNDKTALIYGFVSHLKTFKKTDYFKTPMYDNEILYAEDRDLCYMMEEVSNFYFIDKKLYKYRAVSDSQSTGYKGKMGLINHIAAKRKAISRRGIKGFDLFLHNLINFCLIPQNNKILNICMNYLAHTIMKIIRLTNHSSGRLHRR